MNFLIVAISPWLLLLYALLVIAGGIWGYVKVQSKASLISGLVSGAALLMAWVLTFQRYNIGMGLATGFAIALLIVFALRFRKTQKFIPAGLLAGLSGVMAVVFAIAGLI